MQMHSSEMHNSMVEVDGTVGVKRRLGRSLTHRNATQGARRVFSGLALAATVFACTALSYAQSPAFPVRPVRLVIPFAPGGGTDIVGRMLAQKLSEQWGQGVRVENPAGANGTIGATMIAKSPADGHHLCLFTTSHTVNVTLQGIKQPYDLLKDFTPIIHVAVQPYVLVVRPDLEARSVKELIGLIQAKPGAITFGSSGVGGLVHLSGELLVSLANLKMQHIPYKGGALAMMDVIAGRVDLMFTSLNQSKTFIDAGKLRLLAVTSASRSSAIPQTPTMQEAGVPGYLVESWYGVAGPAGLPAPVVEKINRDLNQILRTSEMRERLASDGATPAGGTPQQFADYLRHEVEKWRRTIQSADIPIGI